MCDARRQCDRSVYTAGPPRSLRRVSRRTLFTCQRGRMCGWSVCQGLSPAPSFASSSARTNALVLAVGTRVGPCVA